MSAAHASWLPRSTHGIPRVRMGGARLPLALLVVPTRCRLYLTVEKRPAEQGRISHVEARQGSASVLPASLLDQLRGAQTGSHRSHLPKSRQHSRCRGENRRTGSADQR